MSISNIESARVPSSDGLNRRERQRLETRERLYETAIAEFRSVGFNDAQIDRIAEKSGFARGTFYFHFPTKEHVLLELQRRIELTTVERIEALGPPPESIGEFCRSVVASIMDGLAEDHGMRREVLAMYVRGRKDMELAAEPLIVLVADYFADAAERGAIRSDIPPEQIADLFLSSLFTVYMGDPPSNGEKGDHANLAIEIFVRGIAPDINP